MRILRTIFSLILRREKGTACSALRMLFALLSSFSLSITAAFTQTTGPTETYRRQEWRTSGRIEENPDEPDRADKEQPGPGRNPQARRWLALYDPDGLFMLDAFEKAPRVIPFRNMTVTLDSHDDFDSYFRGDSPLQRIQCLNTLVHELSHAFTDRLAWSQAAERKLAVELKDQYFCYYLDSGRSVLVHETPGFPSRDIHADFPAELRTERYRIYIRPSKPDLGTQKHGVYGLLDEFNAYFQGTRAAFRCAPFFREEAGRSPAVWLDFFDGVHSTYFARTEFRLYILRYLLHARTKAPKTYRLIMENREFRTVFNTVDSLYGALIGDFSRMKEETLGALGRAGHRVEVDNRYVFIGNEGRGHFQDIYRKLEREMEKPGYRRVLEELQGR
ncbi:hypothetical protein JW906_11995 [bacterium]|nr:hypothetical protein [bacterium]